MSRSVHYRACHLCEAICGLTIETEDDKVVSIKGDKNDPLSRGHICPKAVALKDIHEDPDRLRQPVKRVLDDDGSSRWVVEQSTPDLTMRGSSSPVTVVIPEPSGPAAACAGLFAVAWLRRASGVRRLSRPRSNR